MKFKINSGKENKFYLVLMGTFVVSFIFFFSSKLWMYDDTPLAQTPYHADVPGLDQTTLVLSKWEYNPKEHLMEVAIQTKHTGNDPVKPTFTFTARESGAKEYFPVEVIYQDSENVILHIKEVTDKFKMVGIVVKETRDNKILETEAKANYANTAGQGSFNQDGDDIKYKLAKPVQKVLIGDYRTVKSNEKLGEKSKLAYQEEFIKKDIKRTEEQIRVIKEEQIPHQEELKALYEKQIKSLQDDMKYQTTEEKEATNSSIRIQEDMIQRASEAQEEYKEKGRSLVEKRLKLLERLDALHGKEPKEETENVAEDEVKEGNIEGQVETAEG